MNEKRDTQIEDTELIKRSRVWHQHFLNHQTDFETFDAMFDAAFANNWNSAIDSFEAHDTDEQSHDQLRQYTADVDEAMNAGQRAADDMLYYVTKAFPDSERILTEFGFKEKNKNLRNSLFFFMWLLTMKSVADDYAAELAAVNMPTGVADNLETTANLILEKDKIQEKQKRIRIRLTTQRISKFNSLWHTHLQIEKAAGSIYYGEEGSAKRGLWG